MVSTYSIIFMVFSLVISILFPVGLVIYFYKKTRISMSFVIAGALVFFITQIVIRIPALSFLSTQSWFKSFSSKILLYSLFLGLTAGVFEEVGRFLGFKLLPKDRLEWKNGIAFGLGHGGIEAVILLGFASINNIVYSLFINAGVFNEVIKPLMPGNTSQMIKSQLINTPSYMFAIGGIERIFAIIIQVAFSLIVMYGIVSRKPVFLIYAILLHTLVDMPLPLLSKVSIWVSELYLLLMAVIALLFIYKSKELFKAKTANKEK